MKLIIHTDGGSRGNPGKGACAFVVEKEESGPPSSSTELGLRRGEAGISRVIRGKYLGACTNNEAEYEAVLEALKWMRGNRRDLGNQGKVEEIIFKSDSLLVVSQLSGKWKIKDRNLQQKVREVKELERAIGVPVRYMHIPRELNREADAEVNRVLDKK